jgi:heptosyltransferase-2
VDHVLVYDKNRASFSQLAKEIRGTGFDIIVDLHANMRSWFLRLVAGASKVSVVDKQTLARRKLVWFKRISEGLKKSLRERMLDTLLQLNVPLVTTETQLYPANADNILKTFSIDPKLKLIGVAPGARHNTKRWLPERFAEAASRLGMAPNTMILILGDESDQAVADVIFRQIRGLCQNLAGKTSLPELFSVVSRLSLLLTNDSGLLHVAEALKVPLVAIFGPTVRAFGFAPYRDTSRVVEVAQLPCRPCTLHGDDRCPLGHHNCMHDVDVNAVLFAASFPIDLSFSEADLS